MRFKRYGVVPFRDTARKRAAALRRQQRERDALPLFADQVASMQQPIDEEMEVRRGAWDAQQIRTRRSRAEQWRMVRARLRAYPSAVRVQLLAYWNGHRYLPGDPEYLACVMHSYDRGTLILD